jgi:proline iminopeptidase
MEIHMLKISSRLCLIMTTMLVIRLSLNAQTKIGLTNGEGFAANDSVRIWYKVESAENKNALSILLIHGGPGATARPFEKTIGPELAKTCSVIYMDYRGAGRSDRLADPGKYSFKILASDADAIRKQLGINKWAVFGHSNGGATAITYATTYTNHVSALILCDPLLSFDDLKMNMVHKVALAPKNKYLQARTIYKSDGSDEERFEKLLDLFDQKTKDSFQFYKTENSEVLGRYQSELAKEINKELMEPALIEGLISSGFFQFDAFKSAQNLTMPVLLLLGRYDSEISIDNAMKFALAVPNGYIEMLNYSGHHPYLEQTKESAERIETFLSASANP